MLYKLVILTLNQIVQAHLLQKKKKSSSTMRVTTFIITKQNNGRLYFILKFLNFDNEVSLGVYMLIF